MMDQKIELWIGSDHAGFQLKNRLIDYLSQCDDYLVYDEGPYQEERVDYPHYAWSVAQKVAQARKEKKTALGILLCGTGIGVSLVANKHPEIRAALAHNIFTAEMARKHNDAQILCMGARVIGQDLALAMLQVFLKTEFEEGRHQTRLQLMKDLTTSS